MRYFLFIGILLGLLTATIIKTDDYMIYQIRRCTVTDKFLTSGDHKTYNLALTYAGDTFNMPVSLEVYNEAIIGKQFFLNLRQYDIQQNFWDNLIYFVMEIFVGLGTVVFLTLGVYHMDDQTIPNPFNFKKSRFRKGATREELKTQFADAVANEEFELAIKIDKKLKKMSGKNLFKKFLK